MSTQTEVEPMAVRVGLHPFLVGMNRTQLALLTDCALAVQFKKNQVIFREGEPANRFYLIETGKVILESSGEAGKINISGSTYELVKGQFKCEYRGKIMAKNKGEIDMYFAERIG